VLSRLVWIPVAGALALAGCGGADEPAASDTAPQLSSQVVSRQGGTLPRIHPRSLRGPIAAYKRHVAAELAAMQPDVAQLAAASSAGDLAEAKSAWLAADARYETIGAAYGAFGDLDAAINGRPGGVSGAERSSDFTGLHRIELALWSHHSAAEAAPYAERLQADVTRLRAGVARDKINSNDYVLRAHEVLEDTLQLQLSGVASPWASAALVALRSNIAGTEVVLGTLRPLVAARDPLRLKEADLALRQLRAAVLHVARQDGSLPRWDTLDQSQRELIYGRTAAAAEKLAYIPEIVSPLPPRPLQDPFGRDTPG
jgi:iron uptake system EfeUOB component EfeO/EfeM